MTLAELTEHTANVRAHLEAKREQLPDLNRTTADFVRTQIDRLTPRVAELEAQCQQMRENAA
jgi:hypothetical protein